MIDLSKVDESSLEITKAKLGLTSLLDDTTVRFALIAAEEELRDTYGINLDKGKAEHVNVLTDLAEYNYKLKGDKVALPRHLEYRINNLMMGTYYE